MTSACERVGSETTQTNHFRQINWQAGRRKAGKLTITMKAILLAITVWSYLIQCLIVCATGVRDSPVMNADPKYGDNMFSQQESEFDSSAGQECVHPPCKQLLRSKVRRLVKNWQPSQSLLPLPWPVSAVPPLPMIPPDSEEVSGIQDTATDGELTPIR